MILDAFLKFTSSHYDIRANSWEIRSFSDVSSKTYANSSTSRRYHEYWMRNTDLGMFFYCAQLAIRQFSRYMQTASTQLLTGSWRMKIDTLWFEKQSVGSAARIESMSFRACDLLQCLIFVMTIPQLNFVEYVCTWAEASGIYCQVQHFSNFQISFQSFFSFFCSSPSSFINLQWIVFTWTFLQNLKNCTQFHMITYNWLDWVDSEIIPTLNSFSLFGAKEKKVLWIEHLLPSRDAEVLRFRAGLSEIGPSCA